MITFSIFIVSGFLISVFLWKAISNKSVGTFFRNISWLLFLFIITEIFSNLFLYAFTKQWVYREREINNSVLFEPHSYLIGANKKKSSVQLTGKTYTHNSLGMRGPEATQKTDRIRIMTIGGSTTYGIGVNDWETWPYYLDSLLGNSYEVLNLGVAGYTTAEHIIQSAF